MVSSLSSGEHGDPRLLTFWRLSEGRAWGALPGVFDVFSLMCQSPLLTDSSHTGLLLFLRPLGSHAAFLNSSAGFSVEGNGKTWELDRVWASLASPLPSSAISFYKASYP